MSLTFTEIQSAADRIKSGVVRTPCLESEALSRRLGTSVVVKYENLQHTGTFKARGALSRLLLLSEEGKHEALLLCPLAITLMASLARQGRWVFPPPL
jgi:threonine dehydratase